MTPFLGLLFPLRSSILVCRSHFSEGTPDSMGRALYVISQLLHRLIGLDSTPCTVRLLAHHSDFPLETVFGGNAARFILGLGKRLLRLGPT